MLLCSTEKKEGENWVEDLNSNTPTECFAIFGTFKSIDQRFRSTQKKSIGGYLNWNFRPGLFLSAIFDTL